MATFSEDLLELLDKHNIICNTCLNVVNYDHVLRRDFAEEMTTIPVQLNDTLRRMAAHYLEHASLGVDERKYLETIEGGELPAPLKYGVVRMQSAQEVEEANELPEENEDE